MPKISVIVPVYNVEKYLPKCLDSLVNQTLKDIEIIIINDGSPDNSEEIINDYMKKHSNIKYYKKENGGQGSARNLGIKKSKGEYITFVDSDDYIDVNMLEYMYINGNNADVVVCDLSKVFTDKTQNFINYHKYSNQDNINIMLSHPGPVGRLYKRDIFSENNLSFLEVKLYEDLGLIPIIGIYTKTVTYINKPFYNYLIREGSSMKQLSYNKNLEDIFTVMEHLTLEFNKRAPNQYNAELEYLYIEHLLRSASLRFAPYKEGKSKIDDIIKIIQENFPNWKNNKYYKQKSKKFKFICYSAINKKICFLKLINRLSR